MGTTATEVRLTGARDARQRLALGWRRSRRPWVADVLLAVALLAAATAPFRYIFARTPELLAFQLALLVPLAWRRRAPATVFGLLSCVALAQWLYVSRVLPGDVGLLVALYTVAAQCSLRRTCEAGVVVTVGNILVASSMRTLGGSARHFVGLSGLSLAAAMIGVYVRGRHAYLAALEDRAARLERERDQNAQLAVAQERARIAREMHDIVTHTLSVMVALADGAALVVGQTPERAVTAMEQVAGTGRQALTDMRRFLGVLRADEPDASRHPQPGIAQLTSLATQVRGTGLPVRLVIRGDVGGVPAAAQLTVYRLVQEALTNALKHTAAGTRAVVTVSCESHAVDLEICDDGIALPASAGERPAGHGIDGMRERAAAYGGTLTAGPLPGRGWRVATRLNLTDQA